jgi:hypothetical protein
MPTTLGWKYPGTVDVYMLGQSDWVDKDNIKASDNTYANSAIRGAGNKTSYVLIARNFGYTTADIPIGNGIAGIEVVIERLSSASPYLVDQNVRLEKDSQNNWVGTNHASAVPWSTSEQSISYGSSIDTWDAEITRYNVTEDEYFGVYFQVVNTDILTRDLAIALVDSIKLRVTYEIAASSQVIIFS